MKKKKLMKMVIICVDTLCTWIWINHKTCKNSRFTHLVRHRWL